MTEAAPRIIEVGLGARAYGVHIGRGLIDRAGELLVDLLPRRRAVIVTDATVDRLHGDRLEKALFAVGVASKRIVLPPGEETKSFAHLESLCDALLAEGLERGDMVIAFGGGVIGDLAGFAAAIYKRGIDFIQIPTTLLAQVDSSVGGKTAIDTPRGKNMIGAFHQPRRVLADIDLLSTLDARERRAGYAEILKYGLLGDRAFFDWLEANGAKVLACEPEALAQAVARSVAMKAEIVAEDEREAGRRALLNLGHTFGHALEAETGFGGALLHGEAVGAGMALAFRYSAMQGLCPAADAARASRAIAAAGLPSTLAEARNAPFSVEALIAHMALDKKAEDGGVTLILARFIGEAFVQKKADKAALATFLKAEGAV
jgi:3-dehydroquinate synthase